MEPSKGGPAGAGELAAVACNRQVLERLGVPAGAIRVLTGGNSNTATKCEQSRVPSANPATSRYHPDHIQLPHAPVKALRRITSTGEKRRYLNEPSVWPIR